jgi:type II secretory pathway component GspD/PulD (secretin)
MYRLRKGISSEELQSEGQKINIVEAIERFVPKENGTDLLFDRKAHVLIVRNTRENLAKIEEIVDALDVCPPQVLIEARFIGTSVSDLRELGIDWILNSPIAVSQDTVLKNGVRTTANATQINPTAPNNIVGFTPFAHGAQGANFSYQGLLTDPMFKAVLHALETSGKSRTLSVPKVTTVNNRLAMIRIGEDFRYFEEYDVQSIPSSVSTGGAQLYSSVLVPVGTPQKEELGITLNVTPSVGADLTSIMLHIVPEISEFMRYEYYEVGNSSGDATLSTNGTSMVKLPIFRRSKIETELIVQSGETVVMGGLISSTEAKNQEKVPILGDIPLIGRLFRHDNIEERKQNLLIFVTATILSELGENLVPMIQEPEPPAGGAKP